MPRGHRRRPGSTKLPGGIRSTGSSWDLLLAYYVSDSSDGLDKLAGARRLNFRPQLPHEDIKCIAFDVALVAPHRFHHARAGDHAAGIPHEQLEKLKLDSSKSDRQPRALDLVDRGIKYKISHLQTSVMFFALTSRQCTKPRE